MAAAQKAVMTAECVDSALERMRVGEIYEVTFRMRSWRNSAPRNLHWTRVVENVTYRKSANNQGWTTSR